MTSQGSELDARFTAFRSTVAPTPAAAAISDTAQLIPPAPGQDHLNSYLEYEFVFERRVELR